MRIDWVPSPHLCRVVKLERTIGNERRATLDELLSTMVNRDEIEEFIKTTVDWIISLLRHELPAVLTRTGALSMKAKRSEQQRSFSAIGDDFALELLPWTVTSRDGRAR